MSHVGEAAAPAVVPALIGIAVVTALVWWRRRRAWRRARAAALWVEVEPPSFTETAHGQEMWRQLTGLLRPGALGARTRLLAWELHAGAQQVRAGFWVPGTVGVEDVAEVLDGLWQALAGTPRGYRMTVQVLARPMTRQTRAQARRTRRLAGDRGDRRPHQALPEMLLTGLANTVTGLLVGFLDALLPGPPARTATSRSSTRAHVPALDPITQQERRTAAAKANAELVEVCVRIVAVGPDRRRCRQLAWRAANSLRGVVTAQATDTIRLPRARHICGQSATGPRSGCAASDRVIGGDGSW